MSVTLILLIVALVLFLAHAIGIPSRVELQSLGLAFATASLLVGQVG